MRQTLGKIQIMFNVFSKTTTGVFLSFCTATLNADVIDTFEVGTGESTSSLLFQITNGNQYLYEVSYSGDLTGREAFDVISGAQPDFFIPDISVFSFGESLTGLDIGSDSDSGFGTPPDFLDYWHYWVRGSDLEPWDFASFGFSDRNLSDGSWDGWVFGSEFAPVPGSGSVLALIGLSAIRRRRR
jgi:uncharacterized protein (TIGR03382 family)